MGLNEIPLRRSIALQLLRRIFGLYCLVAIAATGAQMWTEYQHSRERVTQTMAAHQAAVEEGLANAVWHLDQRLLEALLDGIIESETIAGVSIFEPTGTLLTHRGQVAAHERDLTAAAVLMPADSAMAVSYLEAPLEHRFSLPDPTIGSHAPPIATVTFYASPHVALDQVKTTFGSLVVAALVKTLALWLLFIYFARRMLGRPLAAMLDTVRGLPLELPKEEQTRTRRGGNELELLETALNGMKYKLRTTLGELHRANHALTHTNRHLLRAIEQSPTVTLIFDCQATLIYASPSFSTLTGYGVEEAQWFCEHRLRDLPVANLVPQFTRRALDNWRGELPVQDRAGTTHWLTIMLSPVRDEAGRLTHLLATASDVSALKRLEQSLQQKTEEQTRTIAKLEQAHNQLLQSEKLASIGSLAAGIAHEINNPIGYVNANLASLHHYIDDLMTLLAAYEREQQKLPALKAAMQEALAESDIDFIREDVDSLLAESHEGIERVKKIIRDLMDFSRADPEQWTYSDLRKGLESTLNVVWNELKYKAEVVRDFEPIPEIECMPAQINQVFMNLLINAAHAIDQRGIITLRTRATRDEVTVEVADTGRGIAPEHLGRLFDPFFTTKAVGKGTGLGLSISYGIVKKHGGRIEVSSTPGEGSCFSIRLPIQQPPANRDAA